MLVCLWRFLKRIMSKANDSALVAEPSSELRSRYEQAYYEFAPSEALGGTAEPAVKLSETPGGYFENR
jgi:hypothetical protein